MALQQTYIKDIAADSELFIQGLGIPSWMIFAPIAKDWAAYNKEDNRGEHLMARL